MTNYLILSNNPKQAAQLKEFLLQLPRTAADVYNHHSEYSLTYDAVIAEPAYFEHPYLQQLKARNPNTRLVCMCSITAIEQHHEQLGNIFGYLPMPLSFERVVALTQNIQAMKESYLQDKKRDYVFVKSDYKLIKTNFNDIIFLEGMKDYTQIHLKGVSKTLTTLQNLKEFEQKLPGDEFVRVHRSYIVSVNHIESISRSEVVVAKKSIPIGDAYRQSLDMIVARYS